MSDSLNTDQQNGEKPVTTAEIAIDETAGGVGYVIVPETVLVSPPSDSAADEHEEPVAEAVQAVEAETEDQEAKTDTLNADPFDTWFLTQNDEAKLIVNSHISGLKKALDNERKVAKQAKVLEKQLKTLSKGLKEGSDEKLKVEALLKQVQDENSASKRELAFYRSMAGKGVRDVELAFIAANKAGLLAGDGSCDPAALKSKHPSLFEAPQPKPTPPPANGGSGSGPQPGQRVDMNTILRRAAGFTPNR